MEILEEALELTVLRYTQYRKERGAQHLYCEFSTAIALSPDEALRTLIRGELRAALASIQPRQGPRGERGQQGVPGEPEPPGYNGVTNGHGQPNFSALNLGFFYSDLPEFYGTGHVVDSHKETIFREVYIFNKGVYDYSLQTGKTLVKKNLSFCFRGLALT